MPGVAVIGGGPKGVAVATKAEALRRGRYQVPNITVYEHQGIGAAWSGSYGYTDGVQRLCTNAERDLGYPYDRVSFGPLVARQMLARFSWHAFCVEQGAGGTDYDHWVTHHRLPPAHGNYTEYLQFAFSASGAQIFDHLVIGIDRVGNEWEITSQSPNGTQVRALYEGIVITGSGRPIPNLPGTNASVVNGRDFWTQLPRIKNLLQNDPDPAVVIIGAGGTAAAIAAWFGRQGLDIPITIVGQEATLFARHPNWSEDRLFTDSIAWSVLTDGVKDRFVDRLSRGIVWTSVLQELSSDSLNYISYSAISFVQSVPISPGVPPITYVDLCPVGSPPATPATLQLPASVFIDARGFDPWWFVDGLLANHLRPSFANRPGVKAQIDSCLAVGGGFPDKFHVPMLAARQGPAAPNLMALGWMSDRILRCYVTPNLP